VHVAVGTAPDGADTAVTLTVTAHNTTPPGQSQFIAGPPPGSNLPYGAYSGVVAANVPGSATHVTMSGVPTLAVDGPDGPTWTVGALVTIPAGGTSTVAVHFVLPGHHGTMQIVPSARVPSEEWQVGMRTVSDSAPVTITWSVG